MSKIRNQKAITLIALVVTIVILLIISTVAITLLINNNLMENAKTAVDKYNNSIEDENYKLAKYNNQIDNYIESNRDNNASNSYSLDEQRIGTWIDDKPLYRKVLQNTTLTSIVSSSWVNYYSVADLHIGNLVHGEFGRIDSRGYKYDTFSEVNVAFDSSENYIQLFRQNNSLNMPYGSYVIIEYTKTTD